jgi:hypothetical protein
MTIPTTTALPPEVAALPVPSREAAYTAAMQHIALTVRGNEQVWIASELFDEHNTAWQIELLRRGSHGRWVRQRYRFDAQSDTLHFRGEQQISSTELEQARRTAKEFAR